MKHFCQILLLLLIVSGCSYDNKFEQVTVDDKFSIELPDYIYELEGLNPNGLLQYGNKFRNYYTLVLEKEVSEQDYESFINASYQELVGLLENPTLTDSLNTEINGLPGRLLRLNGVVGGNEGVSERILYDLYFVKGKSSTYQITIWTWHMWEETYAEATKHIAESFKVLD